MNLLQLQNGCITHHIKNWQYPTARRIPGLFIDARSKQVAIGVSILDNTIVFKETNIASEDALKQKDKTALEFYKNNFLLPKQIKQQDSLVYLTSHPIYIFSDATYNKMFYSSQLPTA